jgi:hypothetical protein
MKEASKFAITSKIKPSYLRQFINPSRVMLPSNCHLGKKDSMGGHFNRVLTVGLACLEPSLPPNSHWSPAWKQGGPYLERLAKKIRS